MKHNAFDRLMQWFFHHRRDLPWRENRSLYAVLVSEVMLQQTQVSRVIDYYKRFMTRFPSLEALAHSDEREVYKLWEGLGYYRRAKYLLEAAKLLVKQGKEREREWEKLPGIGEYTASAIRVFAFNEKVAVLDANVKRVISRFRGVLSSRGKRLRWWMHAFVEYGVQKGYQPRDINEAFMEVGALICGKQRQCFVCPLREGCCTYHGGGDVYFLTEKKMYRDVEETCIAYLSSEGEVFLVQEGKWRKGLWDLPCVADGRKGTFLGGFSLRYGVTNHRVRRQVEIFLVRREEVALKGVWVRVDGVTLPLGSPAQKCLMMLRDFEAMTKNLL